MKPIQLNGFFLLPINTIKWWHKFSFIANAKRKIISLLFGKCNEAAFYWTVYELQNDFQHRCQLHAIKKIASNEYFRNMYALQSCVCIHKYTSGMKNDSNWVAHLLNICHVTCRHVSSFGTYKSQQLNSE